MAISWGKRQRFRFEAGGALKQCAPPAMSAVYAITYKQDPDKRPKSHTVLYFGESADMSAEVAPKGNTIAESWMDRGGDAANLYVFYHPMPSATMWERKAVQEQLIREYDPVANNSN